MSAILVQTNVDVADTVRTAVNVNKSFEMIGDYAGFFHQGDQEFVINVYLDGDAKPISELVTAPTTNLILVISDATTPGAPKLVQSTSVAVVTSKATFQINTATVEMQTYLNDVMDKDVIIELIDNTTAVPLVLARWTMRAFNIGFDVTGNAPIATNIKNKLTVEPDRAPTAADDIDAGYTLGSTWLYFNTADSANGQIFRLKYNAVGEAVWIDPLAAAGGGLTTVATDSTLTGDGTPGSPLTVVGGGGSGDMLKTVYDSANITEQLVGLTAIQTLTNKTLTTPVINSPTGLNKSDVGLSNVDNTADTAKPVSTAAQTALDLKADAADVSNVDNTSDASKPVSTAQQTALALKENTANKGINNGYAGLDSSGLITLADLPDSVKTGSEYKGAYNAATNTPTLIDGTGSNGDYHRVSVAGSQNFGAGSIEFFIGDTITYDGTLLAWQRIAGNPDLVQSVAGKQGVVTLDKGDVGLSNVDNTTDTGKPVSTAQQTALDLKTDSSTFSTHTSNSTNPHSVTKTQVGLTNVDNTSDASKPVSTAQQTALDGKLATIVEDLTPQLGGVLDTNAKQIRLSKGANVASATALTLGIDGNSFNITGITAITGIDALAVGIIVKLHFDNILTFTHNAITLILPGGANITTATGDIAEMWEYASGNWQCVSYTKANGEAVVVSGGGSGDMLKTVYDSANIAEQLVGVGAIQTLTNKTLTAPVLNSPTGLNKSDVGLINVDNTTDVNKPVSTAQQTALDLKANSNTLSSHTSNVANPHAVTKAQVGLSNVDNTADTAKPVSTAHQTALDLKADASTVSAHTGSVLNPHAVTKAQVGLANADNTSDVNKPVSTAHQTALNLKEDVANKDTNNGYAGLDASALIPLSLLPESVKTGSEYGGVYNATTNTPTLIDGTGSNGDYHRVSVAGTQDFGAGNIEFFIGDTIVYDGTTSLWQRMAGSPDKVQSVAGMTGIVTLAKGNVGLGNVDNTSDANKPVSTATTAALGSKADSSTVSTHTGNSANPHSVTKTQVGLSNADNTSDVNKPISDATQTALDAKAASSTLTTHTNSAANPHSVTAAQVGLGSVNNTTDAAKPISTLTQAALDAKVNNSDKGIANGIATLDASAKIPSAQLPTIDEQICVAISDETTDLTTGTAKVTFRMPFAMTLTAVRASVTTAPTGSVLTVNIKESDTTVLSTKITIDATEKTSQTAAVAPVISDSALADDAEITVDIDTIGSTIAGTGLKVWLIGTRT